MRIYIKPVHNGNRSLTRPPSHPTTPAPGTRRGFRLTASRARPYARTRAHYARVRSICIAIQMLLITPIYHPKEVLYR